MIKKTLYKISHNLPKPYRSFEENIKVEIDLSSHSTKAELKNTTGIDTSNFALKLNLASLKTEVDKLDIDQLITVSIDLSKLSDVAKSGVIKKTVYGKLVTKVKNIDTSAFVLKTKYNKDKLNLERKIPDTYTRGLVKKTDYNAKISEIESTILSICD